MSKEVFHKIEGAAGIVAAFILAYSLFVGFGGSFISWVNLPRNEAATVFQMLKMITLGVIYSIMTFCGLMVMGRIMFQFIISVIKESHNNE